MVANSGEVSMNEAESNQISYNDLSRREVRSLIFHLLYAMEAFEYTESLEALVDNFNRGFNLAIPFDSDVFTISQAVINEREELDTLVRPLLLNWRFERIGMCTRLILRFAFWELKHKKAPPTIIINEAIELSKCFAEKDAYKFVNGVLDEGLKNIPEFQSTQ